MMQRLVVTVATLAAATLPVGCCFSLFPPADGPRNLIDLGDATAVAPEVVIQAHDQVAADRLDAPPMAVADMISGTDTMAEAWYDRWLEAMKEILIDSVECRPITYWSRDADEKPILLTGMLYLPRSLLPRVCPRSVPLLAYPHGTELLREAVPSRNAGYEWEMGAAAALLAGFAVAMPDLPGMGGADPSAYHPYCHAKSLAYAVVDMIHATREALEGDLRFRYKWDGRLYVLGYSEGGYAAMATVRELQLNEDKYGLRVTGSACMAGPYDLTGAMRRVMVDPSRHFAEPFFLPYVIFGYNAVYPGGLFAPDASINPILLPDLVTWMDGTRDGNAVDTEVVQRMGAAPGQVVPRMMMNADWVASQLDDDVYQTSDVGKILAENNLWSGWAPNRPMLLMQSPDDNLVPYANSEKAYNEFVAAGAGGHLTFHPIGKPGDGITHIQGGMIGLPSAIIWLRDICPRD